MIYRYFHVEGVNTLNMQAKGKNMNVCILHGKIVSEINFMFVYNSRAHNSVVQFEMEIDYTGSTKKLRKQVLQIRGYDDLADKMYSEYNKDNIITIQGRLTSNYIEIIEVV